MADVVGSLLVDVRAGVVNLQKDLRAAEKTIAASGRRMAADLRKAMSADALKDFGEIASKAAKAASDAFRELIEVASTEQLNANLDGLSAAWEGLKSSIGSSITQSEAFNVAIETVSGWLAEASAGAKSAGTSIGDVLGAGLILIRAPLAIVNGLLAALNGALGIVTGAWSKMIGGVAAVADAVGLDGVSGALAGAAATLRDVSAGAFDEAGERARATLRDVQAVEDGLAKVGEKAGIRSTSKVVGRKAEKARAEKPEREAQAKTMRFAAVKVYGRAPVDNAAIEREAAEARARAEAERAAEMQARRDELRTDELRKRAEELNRELEEIQSSQQEIGGYFTDSLVNGLLLPLQDGFSGVADILASLKALALDLIAQLIKAAILKATLNVATGGVGGGIISLLGFADGGLVRGPGTSKSDSIPARLSAGEYVVKAAAVQRYGAGFLDAINGMRAPRFADGGLVGVASAGGGNMTTVNVMAFDPRSMLDVIGRTVEPAQYARLSNRQGAKMREATRRAAAPARTGY